MELDVRLFLNFGTIIAAVASAWAVVRNRVNTIEKKQDKVDDRLAKNFEEIFNRLKNVEADNMTSDKQLAQLASMMSPEKIGEYQKQTATFQATTALRLDYLERGCPRCGVDK